MQKRQLLWILIVLAFCRCSGPDSQSPAQEDVILAFDKAYDESLEDRNPDSALVLTNQVLVLQDKITDKQIIFRAYTNAALCHERLSSLDSATYYYRKALELAHEMDDPEKIVFALQMQGNNFIDHKKYRLAEQSFREALQINIQQNFNGKEAANYAGIGLVKSLTGQPDSATASYLNALKVFKLEKDAYNQAIMLGNIADVFIKENMHHNAIPYLREAIKINDSLGNSYSLSQNYNALGTILSQAGQYDSAVFYCDQAIMLSQEMNDAIGEIMGLFILANAKSQAGRYNESNNLLQQVFQFCDTNNFVEGKIRSLIRMGENERALKNYLQAGQYLEEALALNMDENNINLRLETLFALSMLANENNPSGGENYLSAYKTLSDSLSAIKLREHMLDTEAFFHTIEKEKQIDLLKSRNDVQKAKLSLWIALSVFLLLIGTAVVYIISKRQKHLRLANELAQTKIHAQQLQIEKNEKEMELYLREMEKNKLARKLKEQEIVHQAISYSRLIHTFYEIREKLNSLSLRLGRKQDKEAFSKIIQQIDRANGHNPVDEVLNASNELHPDFYPKLSKACSALTPRELQICALISLNMTTKKIAAMLSISDKSTEIARHRIRKKLKLDTTQNLTSELLKYVS